MSLSLEESFAHCRRLARRTGRNFWFSFLALPREQYQAMCALYAFMRVCDDLGDDPASTPDQRAEDLKRWRQSLENALAGTSFEHPVLPALSKIVEQYRIPQEYLYTVIDGVRMDLQPARYATFAELSDYCYHVAGAVGLCCIHIWGFRDERALQPAIDCGLAFQLTNILRDLGEDAAMGRIYLPAEDLERFGYTAEELSAHHINERFHALMRFEVERARTYYGRARELFDYLEPPGRPILDAMLKIYGGLLARIERQDYDVFTRRISLPAWQKVLILGGSIVRPPKGSAPGARD